MIKGLFETHLYVKDLDRSVEFYSNVLALAECHRDEQRKVVFFWIGAPQKAMLGIWQMPESDVQPRHFAFECEPEWILSNAAAFLHQQNIRCYNFLNDGTDRPMVFAWMTAVSLYFNDPDGHILEFIDILDGEAKPSYGVISYETWLDIAGK